MEHEPVDLWLPSRGDALPECLLGLPLLVLPSGDGFYTLATSSLWTPLTWGDSVRARPHPDGGQLVTALAAAGPHLRAVITHRPGLPAMGARAQAHAWFEKGAQAIESAAGVFVVAWEEGIEAHQVHDVLADTPPGDGWSAVEIWSPSERLPDVVAAHLHF